MVGSVDNFNQTIFFDDLSTVLNVSSSRFEMESVRNGSVIAQFKIFDAAGSYSGFILQNLVNKIITNDSSLYDHGIQVLNILDESLSNDTSWATNSTQSTTTKSTSIIHNTWFWVAIGLIVLVVIMLFCLLIIIIVLRRNKIANYHSYEGALQRYKMESFEMT
jgi:hypothetical protein